MYLLFCALPKVEIEIRDTNRPKPYKIEDEEDTHKKFHFVLEDPIPNLKF
jgi:hypothetical protein